jgi:hypothetical protein
MIQAVAGLGKGVLPGKYQQTRMCYATIIFSPGSGPVSY